VTSVKANEKGFNVMIGDEGIEGKLQDWGSRGKESARKKEVFWITRELRVRKRICGGGRRECWNSGVECENKE